MGLKLRIARHLLDRNISPDKVRALMTFLKLYVNFADPETNANFENELLQITENKKTMGIEEMVLERARKEGLEKGLKKGMERGMEKGKAEVVSNLIIKMGMTDAQAADIAGISVYFVKKVRRRIKK